MPIRANIRCLYVILNFLLKFKFKTFQLLSFGLSLITNVGFVS